jgi:very-short-patch-repair endonuclease
MNQFEAALFFYRSHMPLIDAAPRNEWANGGAYAWSGLVHMTPIELWLWEEIRDANVVLYPQFPVDKFFVDFGNPKAKVAIECDGKAFHQDKEKDRARDARLRELGWAVYRISGSDCARESDEDEQEESFRRFFVRTIGARHGIVRDRTAADPHQALSNGVNDLISHMFAMNPEIK